MHWYILVAQIATTLFIWKCCNYLKNRSPINVINGITLPEVDDPRWQLEIYKDKHNDKHIKLQLGSINVIKGDKKYHATIYVNNVIIYPYEDEKASKYINKVFNKYQEKEALKSINETKFPELEEFYPEA